MNLTIRNVPKDVVERLRARAARNQRSLQEELLGIIETAAREPAPGDLAALHADVRRLGLTRTSEATAMIRADRDSR
ncbi:MAG TPA: Arc family DNA-binding protein [Caulobacteraceae bacterium]|nr:Arc family DNA-binding protein [Caulobacteraceae bacterium]